MLFRPSPGPCIVCCAPHCTCVSPDYKGPGVVTSLPARRGLPVPTLIVTGGPVTPAAPPAPTPLPAAKVRP